MSAGFVAGDTITVNGTVLTFVASGATGNQLNVDRYGRDSLSKIQYDHRRCTSISSTGAITLNTGTAANLTVSSSNTAAFAALGFAAAVTMRRAPPTAGTGVVTADDSTDIRQRNRSAAAR